MLDATLAAGEKVFAFAARVLAVPELHALALATAVAFALTYALSLQLPATWLVTTARRWIRAILVLLVLGVAMWMRPTAVMFGWAVTYGVFLPLLYEAFWHRIHALYPWLKPKALMTAYELEAAGWRPPTPPSEP